MTIALGSPRLLYRNRADCEKVFDEMKNQWGWGGFVTHDIKRCQLLARTITLIYIQVNLFVRLDFCRTFRLKPGRITVHRKAT